MDIEYQIAWGTYLGAGLVLFSLWCWVSQIIASSILRSVSRATVFLLIFMPWNLPGEVVIMLQQAWLSFWNFLLDRQKKLGARFLLFL